MKTLSAISIVLLSSFAFAHDDVDVTSKQIAEAFSILTASLSILSALDSHPASTDIVAVPFQFLDKKAQRNDYSKLLQTYPLCAKSPICSSYSTTIRDTCLAHGVGDGWVFAIKKDAAVCTCQCI